MQICGLKAFLGEEPKDSVGFSLCEEKDTSTLELSNKISQEVKQV